MPAAWFRAACERVAKGELGDQGPEPSPTTPEAQVWRWAWLAAQRRFLGGPPLPLEELSRLLGHGPQVIAGVRWALAEELRSAALAFDAPSVGRAHRLFSALPDDSPTARCQREAAELWWAYAQGHFAACAEQARGVEAQALSLGLAPLVIEAAALRAWGLAASGSLDEAIKQGRRASRMARTEALPQAEYLAHLVLARLRRLAGGAHLATRILRALWRVAPPTWAPWLGWESALTGMIEDLPAGPGQNLGEWISALNAGDPGRAEAQQRALQSLGWPAINTDLEAWISAVDPRCPPVPAIAAWCEGQSAVTPPVLQGLLGWKGQAPADDTAFAYVLVDGEIRRRLPRLGLSLIDRARVHTLPQTHLKQGRTEMLLAALALAPPEGVAEVDCFQNVYGFPYEPEVHKGVFDVLIHRSREHASALGTIVRGKGLIRLELNGPILIADPRCTRPLGDALLGVLAESAGASAKEVAKATGVSLRLVQATLQGLVKDGACQLEKGGREVRYLVEDTTFSEPTVRAQANFRLTDRANRSGPDG